MRPWSVVRSVLALVLVVLPSSGCGSGGDDQARAARDREKAQAGWVLSVEDGGTKHQLPLERMDIFVSEDESEAEIFEIRGEGVALVGAIPAELAVGYEEGFEKLVGRDVALAAHGGDPREPKGSTVTLGDLAAPVAGGTLRVEKVTGRWAGSEGDKTLHGTVELRIPTADGERVVRGRFAVHAVTWG